MYEKDKNKETELLDINRTAENSASDLKPSDVNQFVSHS